ncbi:MAG: hypothetical protein K2H22_01815, partial [Muribaculaceae bacterium]|nr:hypothetical protein [Muribaculaceae bacterium]
MKVKSLLAVAAMSVTAAAASAFQWTPVNLYPNPSVDVSDVYFLENLNFNCYEEGVTLTDVMPVWVDEEGNSIKAISAEQNPWGFDPSSFIYHFDTRDFHANGEYVLLFPEGMLVNAAGEKSDKVETPYTLDIPDLAAPMFEDFEILSVSPDLSQPQAIWNNQKVRVNTNHNDAIGLVTLQLIDETAGESMAISSNYTTHRALGDASAIEWEVTGEFKFFEGHEYSA